MNHRRTLSLRRAWLPVLLALGLAATVLAARSISHDVGYHAELNHAAGLRAGDKVRVAGLEVGKVTSVTASGDLVRVDFTTDDDVALTTDTSTEVKLASLLGQRYLALDPGEGGPLDGGDTIDRDRAVGSYTIERFWLEAPDQVAKLDLPLLHQAIDTLSTDLRTAPDDVRTALDGMADVAGIVASRDDQLDRLLGSTRAVTDTLVDQQDELDALLTDADLVMTMVYERRGAIRLLLRDSRRLVVRLTDLARENQRQLEPALRDVRAVLDTLIEHKRDLDRTLELAGPSMRFFTNSTGDGPWLGVNSPYFIFPDDLVCNVTPEECR